MKPTQIKPLIETSVFMINANRIADGTWSTQICQNILVQASMDYNRCHEHFCGVNIENLTDDKKYLIIALMRETLNPFMTKWGTVFFTRKQKPRLYVMPANRRNMETDFRTVQRVVSDLCDTLEIQEVDTDTQEKPPQRKSGIN